MATEKFIDRPLPSLGAWLGEIRADLFEEWVADNLRLQGELDKPEEQQAARLIKTMSIACVEALRIETERHDAETVRAALMLARVTGFTVYCANVCAIDSDSKPPWLRIARILAEEFEHGAKMAARSVAKRAAT
jgi:hypothetical protein